MIQQCLSNCMHAFYSTLQHCCLRAKLCQACNRLFQCSGQGLEVCTARTSLSTQGCGTGSACTPGHIWPWHLGRRCNLPVGAPASRCSSYTFLLHCIQGFECGQFPCLAHGM